MSAPALSRRELPTPGRDDVDDAHAAERHDERDDERATRHDGGRRWSWRAVVGLLVLAIVVAAAVSSPWWVPRTLARLAYFRVRRVEIDGVRYAPPQELLARLHVDTTWSVWTNLGVLAKRVEGHPLVASVHVERRLPGTLRVIVTEREPIAMTPTRRGLAVLGSDGRVLPIDPSLVGGIDVPVVGAPDGAVLRLLAVLRRDAPALYARVSEMRRVGPEELRMTVMPQTRTPGQPSTQPFVLRTSPDVTVERLADIVPVESDLARRRVRVAEIDLRYRDQVIARLP